MKEELARKTNKIDTIRDTLKVNKVKVELRNSGRVFDIEASLDDNEIDAAVKEFEGLQDDSMEEVVEDEDELVERPDLDSDDDTHSTTNGQDVHQVKRRAIAKGKRRVAAKNPESQDARQQDAVAPGAVAAAEAAADADTTGSDTEWSEGFSSDDEAMEERRAARPPKQARRLARGVTMMTVAP